jgi:hypothetical protein
MLKSFFSIVFGFWKPFLTGIFYLSSLSIRTNSKMTLSIKGLFVAFSITIISIEGYFAEHRILFTVTLSVITQDIVMLNVIMLYAKCRFAECQCTECVSVIVLNVVMLNVIMLSFVMLNAVMLRAAYYLTTASIPCNASL